jgi:hypothetical protein
MKKDEIMDTLLAKEFLEHPKWGQHKNFVVDYLRSMADYLGKNPEKSSEPYLDFFTDLMTRVKHEQDKLDFQDDIGGRK